MSAKVLFPSRLTACGPMAATAATIVAAKGGSRSARIRRESTGVRFHHMPIVAGMGWLGGRTGLDQISEGSLDSYGQENSVQAGETDPGP
jgi:hypothetical protein